MVRSGGESGVSGAAEVAATATQRTIPLEQLPGLGEWDGPIHGQLGVLAVDGDGLVVCHACGRSYAFLARHVARAHDLHPDEYRATFGLAAAHGLVSPAVSEGLRRRALVTLRPYIERIREVSSALTYEQRSALGRGRTVRLETRLDPRWQEVKRAAAQQLGELSRARWQALDAEARAARAAHLRRPRTPATCVVCGQAFFSDSHGPRARVCGPACARVHRQRLGKELRTASRPEVRARIAENARRRRPEYEAIVAGLRALGPAGLERLPPSEREAVRLYYGLDPDGRPRSRREVAEATGLSSGRTERLIRTAVAWLLGPGLAGLGALCVVCGHPFLRDRLHSPRVTCGPVCARAQVLASLRASGGNARLAEVARRRGREATGEVRALSERDPAAFASLPAREGLVVRLFHGLSVEGLRVERPWAKREIAAHLGGVTVWQVTQALRRAHERLLHPEAVRSDEEREATKRARIGARARDRGRPGAETLRALGPEAFEGLPEPDRGLVRRYYGLDDGRPWTRRELAAASGRSAEWVAGVVARATARLLGEGAPRPAERTCVVCGAAYLPPAGGYRPARQTCGGACNRELRRRVAIASRAARDGRRATGS